MKRYQFIASDFEGSYSNVDECALARLFKREFLYEKYGRVMFTAFGEMDLGEDRVPHKATNVLFNNRPINRTDQYAPAEHVLDAFAFNHIKAEMKRGNFISASFELVKNVGHSL